MGMTRALCRRRLAAAARSGRVLQQLLDLRRHQVFAGAPIKIFSSAWGLDGEGVDRDLGAEVFLLRPREVTFPFTGVGAGGCCFCRVADLRGDVAIRTILADLILSQ
jgi:hypothetical protein